MKTSTSEGKHGIQWTSRMQLDDLDFADDLSLLSPSQQQMQKKTNSVAAASAAVRLNIHKGKSRTLRYNTECTNPIIIDGEDLEDIHQASFNRMLRFSLLFIHCLFIVFVQSRFNSTIEYFDENLSDKNKWAILVAGSNGFYNYRHQVSKHY
ncbi:unnamed protein product [Schistosoma mattheei]|uniref:Uncharacterized protein n=1 Tax=Schistosoma mattheei TaxID=31246 RepID=A0A183Q2U1_9TREM|nr:unnamed protein product [Schistosoma mattheei]